LPLSRSRTPDGAGSNKGFCDSCRGDARRRGLSPRSSRALVSNTDSSAMAMASVSTPERCDARASSTIDAAGSRTAAAHLTTAAPGN